MIMNVITKIVSAIYGFTLCNYVTYVYVFALYRTTERNYPIIKDRLKDTAII